MGAGRHGRRACAARRRHENADALGNTANPDKIASPDNLKFSEKMRTLFIGEDSGNHVNNFLWAYNVDTKQLTRVLSTPAGAESTGLHAVDDINGWTYIMSNFQHPGDWDSGLHAGVQDHAGSADPRQLPRPLRRGRRLPDRPPASPPWPV
jgi:secreted PhoX family phosphatase